jgi:uncharacterized protein (DUF885 family)
LRELVTPTLRDNIFWGPIDHFPKGISDADRKRIAAQYESALREEILPAYARLADFVERDYLPAARTSVGWSANIPSINTPD